MVSMAKIVALRAAYGAMISDMTTRDDILAHLRRGNLTTAELVERLGISRNAVVVPLGQLVGQGLVRQASMRRSGRAGKPAVEYEIVPGHEDTVSTAYRPLVELLLGALPRYLPPAGIKALMLDIGGEMAAHLPLSDDATFDERLAAARRIVDDMGAATELKSCGDGLIVQSHSCPVAAAVRKEPCICGAVAAFFEAATGRRTETRCIREAKLTCRFKIDGDEVSEPDL